MKYNIRFIALVIMTLIFSVNIQAQTMNDNNNTKYKVVFQLSNNDTIVHKGFVKQLDNLLVAMHNIDIEVVVHGPGATFLTNDSKFKAEIARLSDSGIKFLICRNTLKEKKINETELLPQASIIPAALAHIIKRQAEGWSYIKVGF